jgi:hypothetical protein
MPVSCQRYRFKILHPRTIHKTVHFNFLKVLKPYCGDPTLLYGYMPDNQYTIIFYDPHV